MTGLILAGAYICKEITAATFITVRTTIAVRIAVTVTRVAVIWSQHRRNIFTAVDVLFVLPRCCPQEPTNLRTQHILRQHAFLRARQTNNRCSAGTPPSRERHPSPPLTLPELKTFDQLSPRLPGIGRVRSREETVTGVPLRINNRWPGENGSSIATEQDRGATGLLKALKIRTTPRLTPACSSPAAFTGSTSPNPPTCSCAPSETSERPASATATEASWTVLSASAPSPATTTTTKTAPVSEDDDW